MPRPHRRRATRLPPPSLVRLAAAAAVTSAAAAGALPQLRPPPSPRPPAPPPPFAFVSPRRPRPRKSPAVSLASADDGERKEPNGNGNEGGGLDVGIAGAGSVGMATAALLHVRGHRPRLWSPSGAGTSELSGGEEEGNAGEGAGEGTGKGKDRRKQPLPLVATGAIETSFVPAVARTASELCASCDVVVLALPANGHASVMDALAACLDARRHTVIVSSHASLGALYLCGRLREREGKTTSGGPVPIVAWGTTAVTARRTSGTHVRVCTVRDEVDLCAVPEAASDRGRELCARLFGRAADESDVGVGTFRPRDGLLAISLSNLNAQNHLGIALGNMSRMERGEVWSQGANVTPSIGRLLEALDAERLAIAAACGLSVRTVREHFALSFQVPVGPVSDMNAEMVRRGTDVDGPATADSRYVTEDVPYGLVLICLLGTMVGRPARLHEAGVRIVSAMYGREFGMGGENELLAAMDWLEGWTADGIVLAGRTGRLPRGRKLRAPKLE